ncbi:MAG: hypothetical protein AAB631_00540 [Patescibacteria group bacterium]
METPTIKPLRPFHDTVIENKKERALMIVIEKMMACSCNYWNYNTGDPQKEIPKLFEIAKRIKRAETDAEFQLAIADL